MINTCELSIPQTAKCAEGRISSHHTYNKWPIKHALRGKLPELGDPSP